MPKSKIIETKEEEKVLDPDLIVGDELIPGDVVEGDGEDEDAESALDEGEWEE